MRARRYAAILLILSGCAQPKGAGLEDDDASFKIPAIKSAAAGNDREAIPLLIEDLDSDDAAVRFYAIEALRRITGQTFDYRYYDEPSDRRPAIERWTQWYEQQQ